MDGGHGQLVPALESARALRLAGGGAARNGSGVTAGSAGSDGWAPEHVALVERRVAALRTAWAQLGDDDLLDLLDELP